MRLKTVACTCLPFLTLFTIGWCLLSPMVAMPLYNRMIFEPDHDGNFFPQQIGGCPVEELWFKGDGKLLFGWFVHNPHARKVVLLSHGNGGDLTDCVSLIARLVDSGASVFAYDYEGFGLSKGTPSVPKVCADGLAAYDYLVDRRKVAPSSIVLFGESLGTGVTCQIASARPSRGVILQSGFTSLLDIAREREAFLWAYPNALFPRQRLNSLAVVKNLHQPLLLIHGAHDGTVPVHHSFDLFAGARGPKQLVILPDGDHDDLPRVDCRQYGEALRQFIEAAG